MFEAARVDGASLIIIFLFEFQASWNNLQASLIYLNSGSPEGFTVPLGIA